ncbi:hypothetical protein BDV19DRAFT_390967 [Aspergillus venezuelensis]
MARALQHTDKSTGTNPVPSIGLIFVRDGSPLSPQISPPASIQTGKTATQEEVDRLPSKYIGESILLHAHLFKPLTPHNADAGYPSYANDLANNPNHLIFRRFDRLSVRAILQLQDEIRVIETDLHHLDSEHMYVGPEEHNNGTCSNDPDQDRQHLIRKARRKLDEWNQYMYYYMRLQERPPAEHLDANSLQCYHANHKDAIDKKEREYVEKKDLFSVVPSNKSPLRCLFDRFDMFRFIPLWRVDRPAETLPYYQSKFVNHSSEKRINTFTGLVEVFMCLAMLIAPCWALAGVQSVNTRLGIINGFVLGFFMLVTLAMKAGR